MTMCSCASLLLILYKAGFVSADPTQGDRNLSLNLLTSFVVCLSVSLSGLRSPRDRERDARDPGRAFTVTSMITDQLCGRGRSHARQRAPWRGGRRVRSGITQDKTRRLPFSRRRPQRASPLTKSKTFTKYSEAEVGGRRLDGACGLKLGPSLRENVRKSKL